MQIELNNSLVSLKEAIDKDPDILKLNEIEERLNKSEDVMALSYKKDVALREYEDILRFFKEDPKEAKEKQASLAEAKYNLDTHPLVKEYNEAYKKVRDLFKEINDILFKEFEGKKYRCD